MFVSSIDVGITHNESGGSLRMALQAGGLQARPPPGLVYGLHVRALLLKQQHHQRVPGMRSRDQRRPGHITVVVPMARHGVDLQMQSSIQRMHFAIHLASLRIFGSLKY